MDPITTAIVAALSTGVARGVTKLGENSLVDAYEALKAAIKHKLGVENEVTKAVESLEARANSSGRKEVLKEEVAAAKADKDPDILKEAQTLLSLINSRPDGEQHIQYAIGGYIAQADRGSTASITIDHPKE